MLQQTRVDAVTPYYTRWIDAFPTIDALASSDIDAVLKLWEGLGYYARARNLHATACIVREQYGSRLPDSFEALRALPGIGTYTAGAISSIAYNRKRVAVDGNVRRVLARLFDLSNPSALELDQHAAELIDTERPGDFNQALMELGATICTPRKPLCGTCPIHSHCAALANDAVQLRPAIKPKKSLPHEIVHARIVLRDESVLLSQRPASGPARGTLGVSSFPNPSGPLDVAR